MINTEKLLNQVNDYDSFYTLKELDKRAFELAEKYRFEIKEVGKSFENHPLYLIKAGHGDQKLFIWGFPHPNEPIGSLTIDWLINYLGNNKEILSQYTWYFIYTADPDGTNLNEGWFKEKLTIEKYFLNFYRPPANRQIDWTFPVKYKEFEWNNPMPETIILMKIINEINPDLMYPLHNSGFGGAFFLSNKKFEDEYYDKISNLTKDLGIPLDMGEPEEFFMKEIRKPFYFDFGFKEYYEEEIRLKKNLQDLKHGNNSMGYLTSIKPEAIVIKGEVPYFYDEKVIDTQISNKTKRDIWLNIIEESDENIEFYLKIIPKILSNLEEPDPHWYLIKDIEKSCKIGNSNLKEQVLTSSEYDKKATESELFYGTVVNKFYRGLAFGQVRRAAIKAQIDKELIKKIDDKLKERCKFVSENSNWKLFPIKKLVQLQLLVLFETLNEMEKSIK